MNRVIYLGERQSHKTSMAIYRFMENPEDSLLITHNQSMVKSIKDLIQKNFDFTTDNVVSAQGQAIIGRAFKNIIFDEFFFWNESVAKSVFASMLPVLTLEDSSLLIYSSLSNKFEENIRQKLTLQQMKNSGWKLINMFGGIPTPKEEIRSWLFDTPESKINEIAEESYKTGWRKHPGC